jgi:serine/threonine protein kinase
MNWRRDPRQFQLIKLPNRHYVFRRNNSGNTEINVPKTIRNKFQARDWLANHPNAPTKFKPKKKPAVPGLKPFEHLSPGGRKYTKIQIGGKLQLFPVQNEPNFLLNIKRARGENVPWGFTCDLRRQLKVFTPLGKGRQGIVYKASRYSNGRHPFAIKVAPRDLRAESAKEEQPAKIEFDIQSAVEKETAGVVRVYQMLKCPNFVAANKINMPNVQNAQVYNKADQMIILMEYCSEGTLKSWISKQQVLDDSYMHWIIISVLKTLSEIHRKYPYFSHNDLHLENVFVGQRGVLIGDFGWARLQKMGTNPAVNTANGTRTAAFWGVGPATDKRYDSHLFLNELREWIERHAPGRFPKTRAFLDFAIPSGYRGENDAHVANWRLKYRDPCSDLPGLTKLLAHPYIAGRKMVTSAELVRAKARLRKTGAAAVPKNNAPPKTKKAYTNKELINMSAANFLKLSPATRARAKNLRARAKMAKGKTPAPAPKVNLTARVKKVPSPPKVKHKPFPTAILKTSKFTNFVTKIYTNQPGGSNENYYNAWNRARTKAMQIIQNRVNKNLEPFSPSPPKPKSPTPPKRKTPSPPKRKTPSPPKRKTPSPKKASVNYKFSPNSGRVKIKAPNSGRFVYANGPTISLAHLKSLASTLGVNIKGLRSKVNIAKKLFPK